MPQWPSLNALHTFLMVCRHLSMKRAARELRVTPAAVSQQVRLLEEHFGFTLVRRTPRGVQPTERAQRLLPELSKAFDSIERVVDAAQQLEQSQLRVAVAPAFAAAYLASKLGEFTRNHNGIEVSLLADSRIVDYAEQDIDIGVRYGRGHYTGLAAERLMADAVFPVSAPKLAARRAGRSNDELPLLHDDSLAFDGSFPTWATWFSETTRCHPKPTAGPRFNTAHDAIAAAIAGDGMLLARRSLVRTHLATGRLQRTSADELTVPHGFFVVYRPSSRDRSNLHAFRDWLHDSFGDTRKD